MLTASRMLWGLEDLENRDELLLVVRARDRVTSEELVAVILSNSLTVGVQRVQIVPDLVYLFESLPQILDRTLLRDQSDGPSITLAR